MKHFILKFNIVFLILFMISVPAFSGQLSMWVDENGVTHFTNRPPPADTESETIKYKERKSTRRGSSRDSFEYMREMESQRNENIERLQLDKKYEQRKIDREKREQQRELDKAKKDYRRLKRKEAYYKENVRDAYSRSDREYWRSKLKELEDAESYLRELKNK